MWYRGWHCIRIIFSFIESCVECAKRMHVSPHKFETMMFFFEVSNTRFHIAVKVMSGIESSSCTSSVDVFHQTNAQKKQQFVVFTSAYGKSTFSDRIRTHTAENRQIQPSQGDSQMRFPSQNHLFTKPAPFSYNASNSVANAQQHLPFTGDVVASNVSQPKATEQSNPVFNLNQNVVQYNFNVNTMVSAHQSVMQQQQLQQVMGDISMENQTTAHPAPFATFNQSVTSNPTCYPFSEGKATHLSRTSQSSACAPIPQMLSVSRIRNLGNHSPSNAQKESRFVPISQWINGSNVSSSNVSNMSNATRPCANNTSKPLFITGKVVHVMKPQMIVLQRPHGKSIPAAVDPRTTANAQTQERICLITTDQSCNKSVLCNVRGIPMTCQNFTVGSHKPKRTRNSFPPQQSTGIAVTPSFPDVLINSSSVTQEQRTVPRTESGIVTGSQIYPIVSSEEPFVSHGIPKFTFAGVFTDAVEVSQACANKEVSFAVASNVQPNLTTSVDSSDLKIIECYSISTSSNSKNPNPRNSICSDSVGTQSNTQSFQAPAATDCRTPNTLLNELLGKPSLKEHQSRENISVKPLNTNNGLLGNTEPGTNVCLNASTAINDCNYSIPATKLNERNTVPSAKAFENASVTKLTQVEIDEKLAACNIPQAQIDKIIKLAQERFRPCLKSKELDVVKQSERANKKYSINRNAFDNFQPVHVKSEQNEEPEVTQSSLMISKRIGMTKQETNVQCLDKRTAKMGDESHSTVHNVSIDKESLIRKEVFDLLNAPSNVSSMRSRASHHRMERIQRRKQQLAACTNTDDREDLPCLVSESIANKKINDTGQQTLEGDKFREESCDIFQLSPRNSFGKSKIKKHSVHLRMLSSHKRPRVDLVYRQNLKNVRKRASAPVFAVPHRMLEQTVAQLPLDIGALLLCKPCYVNLVDIFGNSLPAETITQQSIA